MRQFQRECLDFECLSTNFLLSLIKQRLNHSGYLLPGIRIKVQLIKLHEWFHRCHDTR